MELTMRAALLAACAVLALAACQRREEAPPAPPQDAQPKAEVTPADQAAPLTYERDTEYAEVSLTLPQPIARYRDLHASLYGEAVANLREFLDGAQADRTEYGGDQGLPAYNRSVEWRVAAETGKLFSLAAQTSEYTGGAHGMTTFSSLLWDKALDRRIEGAALFRRGADMAVLDRALCDAINAARAARTGEPSNLTVGGAANDWSCPRAMETTFALAPSATAGKAGGLEFLINPYDVGPYAEGTYQIVVPQSAFRALLAPAYADEFAGAPARVGDVTPREPVTPS